MTISSQHLWSHIRDAFGISPDLSVKDFQLNLAVDTAAEIKLTTFAGYDPETEALKTITSTFKLGEKGVPTEHVDQAYWSGFRQGFDAGKDPIWMHAAHLISFDAKQQLQQMADDFNNKLWARP